MLVETITRRNMLSTADIHKKLRNRNLKYTQSKHQASNMEAMKIFEFMITKLANHKDTTFRMILKKQKQTNAEKPTLQEPNVLKS